MSKEVVRKAIVDWDGNNILASVVQSTTDPTKFGIVICNPDGSPINTWWSSITLKTNWTNNWSQSILNLKAGTNVTLTDDWVGGVTIASTWGGGWWAVDSVNWQTWVVVLDQDDILDGTTYKQYSDAEKTKLAWIEAWAQVNTVTPTNTVTFTNKTLTEPKFADDGFIADANGNEMVSFNSNANAVNYLEIENWATGNPPHLRAMWDDTNIWLHLVGKWTWEVSVCDAVDETKRLRFWVSNNWTWIITTLRSNSTGTSKIIDLPNVSGTVALTSDLTDFVTTTQAQNWADKWAVTWWVANTYTLTLSPAITSYVTGQTFQVQFHAANTGASTINVNWLGAKSLVKDISTALVSWDIPINQIYTITYNGTNFLVRDIGFAGINTSARLAWSLSDETGTGVVVFGTSPTFTTSVVWWATFSAFNTTTTNLSLAGATTTLTVWGTPTTAITHTYSGNATATGVTKTLNIGTGWASGSITAINVWSATSGATNNIKMNIMPASDATGDIYYRNASWFLTRLPIGTTGQVVTVAWGIPSWATPSWSSTKELRITIPWEQIADTSAYQGLYFKNTSWATWTISNVAVSVAIAAAGSWAACSVNVYKSSGTASDGINTSAVALFSSAIALWTGNDALTNVPTTTTVENWRWLSLRVTSSAWATNRAQDLQVIITYT